VTKYRIISNALSNSLFPAYQCVWQRDQNVLVISPLKLWQFWRSLVHRFPNKLFAKSCKRFPPHLNNVSKLPCETSNAHRARWVVRERNSRIYSTSTVASKFPRFESSWLQSVKNIARECVWNTQSRSASMMINAFNQMTETQTCKGNVSVEHANCFINDKQHLQLNI